MVVASGKLLKWPENEVSYRVDQGGMGPYSEEYIQQMVIKVANEWSNIPTSAFRLRFDGFLDFDVTSQNFNQVISNTKDGINPIILDSDGSIIDQIAGDGASEGTLGLSIKDSNDQLGVIDKAVIIINGKILKNEPSEIQRIFSTLLHEFGHFIGLSHSQLHLDFFLDNNPINNIFLPIMFPIEPADMFSTQTLSEDDRNTLSTIYPNAEHKKEYGTIRGSVLRPFGDIVQGANVIATKIDSPLVNCYSVVSDLFINQTGEYTFVFLPPGDYEINIEPVYEAFWGPSAVGPFADTPNSPSFFNPVIKEYYNGPKESGYSNRDYPEDKVLVTVKAGEITENIDIISNEDQDPSESAGWLLYE